MTDRAKKEHDNKIAYCTMDLQQIEVDHIKGFLLTANVVL